MRLVPEYTGLRDHWRWFSLRIMWFAAALQGAWVAIPEDLKLTVPEWAPQGVTAVLMVAGVIGRLVPQDDDE